MTDTRMEVDLDGRHYVLELNADQLAVRGPGDLITAQIVDVGVEATNMESFS